MIHTKFTRITRQATLFVSTILFFASDASGLNIDPFSFCVNSCKSPGLCSTEANLKSQCEKVCGPDHIWKHAGKLQMSSQSGIEGQNFRKATLQEKDTLVYNSDIAKCLGKVPPKVKESTKVEESTPPPAPAPMKVTAPKEDLCAAAVRKAMADLESDKTALDHGKTILETQKQDLAAALKAHESATKG